MRGAVRHFIEATTPYKVCDAVDNGASAIHKATEARCDLILLNLSMPLQDNLVTVSLLRSKLPHVKIFGSSTSSVDLGNLVSPTIGFDAVLTRQQGLSRLVETLKALMPERHESNGSARAAKVNAVSLPGEYVIYDQQTGARVSVNAHGA